jgi:hypothetical protein
MVALMDDIQNEDSEGGYWDAFLGGAAIGASVLGAKSAIFKHPGKNRMVGFVSEVAQKSEWKRLGSDEYVTGLFDQALDARFDTWRTAKAASDGTFLDTWRAWTNSDADEVSVGAEMMSWITGYAVHRAAKAMAGVNSIDEGPKSYYIMFDKLVGMLNTIDLDNSTDAVLEAAARMRVRGQELDDLFGDEYAKVLAHFKAHPDEALELVGHQNRMSRGLMTQLFLMEDIAASQGSTSAAAFLGQMRTDMPGAMDEFVEYLGRNLDAVGDWNSYSARMNDLYPLEQEGLWNGATLRMVDTPFGQQPVKGDRVLISKAAREVDRAITGSVLSEGSDPRLLTSRALALLGNNAPTGRMALMKKTTLSAQEVGEQRAILRNFDKVYDALQATVDVRASDQVKALGDLTSMSSRAVGAALRAAGFSSDQMHAVRRIRRFAKANGISSDEVLKRLDEEVTKYLDDADFWTRADLPVTVRVSNGQVSQTLSTANPTARRELLKQRLSQLSKKEHYTAAEVDTVAHIERLRQFDPAGADRLQAFVDSADAAGYRLVHGVDFLLPSSLAKMDKFNDLSVRHMNAITLGNFFKGKLPAIAHANQERRQRAALSNALMNAGLTDATPESDRVTRAVADLFDILQRAQDEVADSVSSIRQQNILQRTGTRVGSTGTPLRVEDLAGSARKKRLFDGLAGKGYTEAEIKAIWKAVPKFRNAEFKDVGLYALEAGLRERNQLAGALKFFSRPTVAATVGFYAGAAVGSSTSDPNASEFEVRARQLGYGLLGGAAGAAGAKFGSGVTVKAVDALDMSRYGYIADGLARARDTLRFSLSPMFDLSRYVEGYMLGQIGGPMRYQTDFVDEAGKVVARAGDRVILPADISPTGLRRRIKKSLGGGPEAARQADSRFNQYLAEFRASALGDFDPQELDSTGRWFAQVGIMGFNPTDWMASAFGELRRAGFSSAESYKHARAMYTYGMTGRSAAEMSVNFVVFPFSFQKKLFTHIGQWLGDDLSRAWLLHDGFKAYDVLSDKYNLDDVWKEHLPALQQLRRLNSFAYGLSAGQWGGVNRKLIEPVVKAGSELSAQLFAPGAYSIGDRLDIPGVVSAAELTELHESLIPAINDINWMIENAKEQAVVVRSGMQGGEWLTSRAQSAKGWDEWNEFRDETAKNLAARGFSWADLYSKEFLSAERLQVQAFRADLAARMPAWANSQITSTSNSVALEMERKNRVAAAAANLDSARLEDFQMAEMEQLVDYWKEQLAYMGITVGGGDSWVDAPPEVFYAIQDAGREMVAANPKFEAIWEKYYRDDFGVLKARI